MASSFFYKLEILFVSSWKFYCTYNLCGKYWIKTWNLELGSFSQRGRSSYTNIHIRPSKDRGQTEGEESVNCGFVWMSRTLVSLRLILGQNIHISKFLSTRITLTGTREQNIILSYLDLSAPAPSALSARTCLLLLAERADTAVHMSGWAIHGVQVEI